MLRMQSRGSQNIGNIHLSSVVSLLLLALGAHGAKTAPGKLDACAGKKIHILDIGVFAKETGVPLCNLATVGVLAPASNELSGALPRTFNGDGSFDIKIDPMNGIPFLPGAWQVKHVEGNGAPIAIAAHSGPWHLRQTIRGSVHYTANMEEADIIYVYDHCYYMRWLGQVHSNGPKDQKEASEGGEWMMKGLQALVKTDRWKKNDGSDFVFFDPHPGFTDGTSDKEFKTLMCHTSKKSMHIVVERGQINICPDYWEMHDKLVIAPYVAGSSDVAKPLLGFKTAITPIKERKTFLYLTASCLPYAYENWNQTKIKGGKQFRHAVQLILGNLTPDVDVKCVDPTLGGHYTPFPQVLEIMQTATFCLVLPGDSASSRRTSEIFMSGCIPVFIGPPYATMPFGDAVDYKAAAYFFNITDHKFWFDSELLWENPKDVRPYHVQTAWYWFPDATVNDAMIQVKSLPAMLKYLRNIPEADLQTKLTALGKERLKFAYRHKLSKTPTASSVIISEMCTKYNVKPTGAPKQMSAAAAVPDDEEDEEE